MGVSSKYILYFEEGAMNKGILLESVWVAGGLTGIGPIGGCSSHSSPANTGTGPHASEDAWLEDDPLFFSRQ